MSQNESISSSSDDIPLVDLGAQLAAIRDELDSALARVLDSHQFILGPEVEAFESEIANHIGCRYASGVSSGTDALLVSLMALDIGPGDEVITTPFSFVATAACIVRLGAKPVFVDIDPNTFLLNENRLEEAITGRTRAILPVHLYGQCAAMDVINEVAARHDLKIVEDAAQSIGARCADRSAGQWGQLGCFSFFPTKNLGGCGDGGLITTDDDLLAERVRALRSHGFAPKYYSRLLGGNFRLDALQAAVLRVKLPYLNTWNLARRTCAATYNGLLSDRGLLRTQVAPDGVVLPYERAACRHVYHQYVIRTTASDREALRNALADRRIATEVYYPAALHLQDCFRNLGYQKGDFPESERAATETLALPLYPELTEKFQQRVADAVGDYYAAK